MCSVAWGAMLVSSGAYAEQRYFNADGTTTTDLEAAAATWRALPAFAANPALKALNAEYAYAYGYRGNGAQLGLVDTSAYTAHPGLAGSNLVPIITTGTYAVTGTLPGQVAGKSFKLDPTDLNLNVYPGDIHGTVMSGFAIGSGANGYPQGVAPGATLFLARSIGQNYPTELKAFDDGIFTASYQALVDHGARAITSMWQVGKSVYTPEEMMRMYNDYPTSGLLGAMENAAKKGVLMIMPNGNFAGLPGIGSSLPYFRPELERNWLAVAATSDGQSLADYSNACSNYAKWWCVTSTALGNAVSYSPVPTPGNGPIKPTIYTSGGGGGTSEASADTLGAVGVLLQRYPYLAGGEIRDILLSTARPLDDTGVSDKTGFGLIDLKEAMNGPKQLLGNFNASLPGGVTDTWSNPIGDSALAQRKREERAELATLQATTPAAFRASVMANIGGVSALLDNLLAKIQAMDPDGAREALAAAKANPVALILLAPLLNSPQINNLDYLFFDEVREALAKALPNYAGPLTADFLDKTSKSIIDNYELRLKYLSGKSDADYVGTFTKTGWGTLVLTGASTYTGPTEVAGGQLVVNGSLVSNVTIDTGAILAGVGQVGSTKVSTGGVLAPGYLGAGTFTINGNLTFASGSYYLATLNQAGATTTAVTGTAALDGIVLVAPAGMTKLPRAQTILTSAGLNGTQFARIDTPVALIGQLGYTNSSVNMSLYSGLGKVAGLGGNQVAVGSAIDASLNAGATITPGFLSLLTTPTAQALQSRLSSVSGESQAAAPTAFSQGMNMVLNTMLDPNGAGRSTPLSQPSTPPPGMSNLGVRQGAETEVGTVRQAVPRYTMWGAGYGAQGTVSGSASAGTHTTSSRVFGSAGGLDYRVSPQTTAGFTLGGGTISWGLSDGLGSASSDTLHAGLYGITRSGPTYLSGAMAFGWMGGTTQRTVSVMGLDRMKSDTNAEALAMRVESGIRVPVSQGLLPSSSIVPYAALQAQRISIGSTAEQSAVAGAASPFALTYGSQLRTFTRTELGARVASRTQLPDGTGLTLQARAAWAHDFDTDTGVNASFQSLPGTAFTVAGARPASDGALLSAGAEMQLTESISTSTNFDGEFSSTTQFYSGTVNVRVQW